jgi:hypothetical protein
MNSSTSSSDLSPRARGVRIALLIAAVLLLIEWGARATVLPGSADLDLRLGARARALFESPPPRIAFVGNSVADRVRLDVMADQWKALTGETPSLGKFVTYYSNLSTWRRMSAQIFWKRGLKPDLIVVTYYEGNTLSDSKAKDIGNLALYFTGPEDRQSLFAQELTSVAQRAEYLLSSASDAFASRDRIRDAALHVIPGYRPFATATNEVEFKYEQRQQPFVPFEERTYRTLAGFLADAREAGVTICFVASPPRPEKGHAPYIINPRAAQMITEAGMLSLDLRHLDGLTADMYSDQVHLNAIGSRIYTRALADAINAAWKRR